MGSTKTESIMENTTSKATPWNKGKLVGQKLPLNLKEIWAIRVRLQLAGKTRDLALFNIAIDSKLRGSDLVRLRVSDICNSGVVSSRAMILQKKTSQAVQFEIAEGTRESITEWIEKSGVSGTDYLFPSRIASSQHLSTRQYARIVERWVSDIDLDSGQYGTHSLRRTKPTLIYKRTRNLRAVQLLLGHTKLESTVRYLGVEVDDALEITEQTEI